ncbi:Cache domain-containing protein [Pedobacter caeni]|uniref:Cache domain-containing protein n=2 Tax=Pedobacter caeni TaxID=288992 RepID=A0A1M5IT78_9SPHI|nr:Cache domain-containing protein [Pedobacter caeni]
MAIGFTIFLFIAGIILFTGHLVEKRLTKIAAFSGVNVYRQKVNVFRYEFNNLLKGTQIAANLFPKLSEDISEKSLNQSLGTLLLSDEKVRQAWYVRIKGKDTSFVYLLRKVNTFQKSAMPGYVKVWVRKQLLLKTAGSLNTEMINVADSLHWLTATNKRQQGNTLLLMGLDINLKDLQRSFYDVDATGISYAFIVDETGLCITNPNEKLIGQRLYEMKPDAMISQVIADGNIRNEVVMSDYLKLPVTRYYIPDLIKGLNWTIIVDIPGFVLDEDLAAVRSYSIYMGLIAVAVILTLIWLYQRRWQKEFLLRREVEIHRQELSMEKQMLNTIAERQQKENALLQLGKLKEKVNPHFLFNSLSSLNALIVQDPDLAKSFVVKLSRVYRYVLESYPNGLATVAEELRFMNEYFFLLKIRFGEALQPLDLDLSEEHLQGKIPFMSLQTLIENAVKHNVLSKSKPLKIRIESRDDGIVVSNNLQLRPDVRDSGKQGLNYLQSTYAYFGNEQLKYGIEAGQYQVYLPVLYLTE